jgi:copper transport protein
MNGRARMGAVALAAILALGPALLWAHTRLTRSEPAANERLRAAPLAIRLWFSEAPEPRTTSIQLRDASGNELALGAPAAGSTKLEVGASILGTLRPGLYHVTWRIVGKDGHPIAGRYSFDLLDSAPVPTAAGAPPVAGDTPADVETTDVSAASHVIVRALVFGGLVVVIGVLVFQLAVLVRASRLPPPFPDTMSRRAAMLGMNAALVVVIASLARIYLQAGVLALGTRWYSAGVLILETQWGQVWLAGLLITLLAAVGFRLAARRRHVGWRVAAIAALALAFIPALGGHAVASPRLTVLAVVADGLHVLGAAGWLGSLACVVLIGFPTLFQDAADQRWELGSDLVHAFSPVALGCAALVAATGAAGGWLRLGGWAPLWTSGYGRVLLVKLLFVAATVAAGAYNNARLKPALGTDVGTRRIRRSAQIELAFGVMVVISTAILVALPTPADAPP